MFIKFRSHPDIAQGLVHQQSSRVWVWYWSDRMYLPHQPYSDSWIDIHIFQVLQVKLNSYSNASIFKKSFHFISFHWKKYTSGPRYWNVPVLVNTGTFLVYQYCLKMWYLRSLEHSGVIQKLTILERKNDLVLLNTHVPVSGTWSMLFPFHLIFL